MRLVRSILIAIVVASAATAASFAAMLDGDGSASVAAPDWRPGSSWEYSDGYGLRVASSGGGVTTFERLDAAGQWFSMRGFLRQDAASAAARRQTIYRTAPPTAGDTLSGSKPLTFQREYLSNGQLIVHATSWTVEGRERITVPAGTFDCWVIVWRARSLKSDWTGFERWWYSPDVQNYVRLEYKYGAIPTASRVLMRYRLAPGDVAVHSPDILQRGAIEVKPIAADESVGPPNVPELAPLTTMDVPEPQLLLRPTPVITPRASEPAIVAEEFAPISGHWFVQIASVSDEAAAEHQLAALDDRIADLPSGIEKADLGERGIFYRVWAGDYDEASGADALCRELKSAGDDCFVRRH